MYLVTADEMRRMDRLTIESFGLPGRILMENAGKGATEVLLSTLADRSGFRIGVAAGGGNNGGDGFVIARYLAQKGIRVTVYLLAGRDRIGGDAKENLCLLAPMKIPVVEMTDGEQFAASRTAMAHEDLWVDAILGTGLESDVRGYYKDVIDFMNHQARPVFSVDIPSGLNSDTGRACGVCIQAQTTATFAFPKIGHMLYPGAAYTGDLHVVDIGIPSHIADRVAPRHHLMTAEHMEKILRRRSPEAHKGTSGHLLILSGSSGKTGAAAMTAVSAMRAGAGLVTLGIPGSLNEVAETLVLEAMTLPLAENRAGILSEAAYDEIMEQLSGKKCLAIGPGIGTAPDTARLVHRLIETCRVPLIIDADGLNNIAGDRHILKSARVPVVITPHPGEMARLAGITARQVQEDRIGVAGNFASTHSVYVVLKGARTVIALPDGTVYINPTGNSGMAAGGMGDVLTGVIAGLVTQGYPPDAAARIGVYLHGSAADRLAETIGPVGFLAKDVINAIPGEIKRYMTLSG